MAEQATFSIRIKELRSSLNMTQVQFAKYVGTNQVTISSYEVGSTNPSLEAVKEIAQKCSVSIDWLCGLSDKKSLGESVATYSDLFRIILNIFNAKCNYDDHCPLIDKISINDQVVNITFHEDEVFSKYVSEWWTKMAKLHSDGIIDDELYTLWIEKQLTTYKDHAIDGVSF